MEQATIAVLWLKSNEKHSEVQTQKAWTKMSYALHKVGMHIDSEKPPLECSTAIALPTSLPTLCHLVGAAQESGLQYKVELFGQSILQFSSEGQS